MNAWFAAAAFVVLTVAAVNTWRVMRLTRRVRRHSCPPPIALADLFAAQDREWERRTNRQFVLHNVPETGGKHRRQDIA